MKIKKSPDKEKAKSLFRMAETTLKRLNKMDKEQFPSNTLIDYYDIIHQLMEGLTSIEGVKIKGKGAHYELIKHVCSKYGFSESTEDFLQQIRKFRNRISYEGFFVNKDFIERNSSKIQEIINKLNKINREALEKEEYET